ncbi:acyl-CoA synthetase [Novosphingobium cyanobacteriorum]|uniref:Acyl-CoA synthetase n=1 Tax=Novosphingobium cyanobacteriorum TaxID=3024215 RepID=A0ABT6CF71_9SPHN|nr:acyl-CoA synthetase [Novosphingobium cyanobacteriorum]MDF8332194.1 acyl-CoA synthetase [Novosphingobium cyanobacteriorum]
MHPSIHARINPDKPAMIMAESGVMRTYGEVERHSNQGAHLFRSLGLKPGDTIAICMENRPEFFEVVWAAQRSGLFFVSVSTKLQIAEISYILEDSSAGAFVTSAAVSDLAHQVAQQVRGLAVFSVDGARGAIRDYSKECSSLPATPIADEEAGIEMLYSSGTTGRPKGIRPTLKRGQPITLEDLVVTVATKLYGAGEDTVYLCPAPLYHAAPLRYGMAMMRIGATLVIMERFDPESALSAIQRYRVTMVQFVPTHFIRMLKLPQSVREGYDIGSLKSVVHAAAPCPVPVKEAMMEWFGPIIHEYYSGSEGNGSTFISPQEWLAHKGSVGRPISTKVHICDENGNELPPRSEGIIYFSGGPSFEYHNDAAKTRESLHEKGWSTLGDIGWVDEDGYLYLTDRKSFMIISGGVNIYPQEIENLLITHPKVMDVAVIGAPDPEMGEKVVAVVQPGNWAEAGDELAAELTQFVRDNLSHVKTPRKIDFMQQLPRLDTGKLYKRLIRDKYWQQDGADAAAQPR